MLESLIISGVIAVVILVIMRMWLSKIEEKAGGNQELIAWMKELGARVETSQQMVDQKLSRNMEMFNTRLDRTAESFAHLQKSLGEMSEIGRSMQDLQVFLQSPKLRGNLGEQILKELLTQYFPPESFTMQHTFQTGDRVDAIIKISHGIIPIDSKFPVDNFRRMLEATVLLDRDRFKKEFLNDVKKHMKDIARKYILVHEGTVDYALMYIPSESVYYEIINDGDLSTLAASLRVLPVSPLSFYAYMKAILMSIEGHKIQSQAKEILDSLRSIKRDYERTDEALNILQKHITNAYNQTNLVGRSFETLGQKITANRLLEP